MNETAAARALLAYFNRPLVLRLVKRIMNEATPVKRRAVFDAMLERIPKMLDEQGLHTQIKAAVGKEVQSFVDRELSSERFARRVQTTIEFNLDRWLTQLVEEKVKQHATEVVDQKLRSLHIKQTVVDGIHTRFTIEVENLIKQRAVIAVSNQLDQGTKK